MVLEPDISPVTEIVVPTGLVVVPEPVLLPVPAFPPEVPVFVPELPDPALEPVSAFGFATSPSFFQEAGPT